MAIIINYVDSIQDLYIPESPKALYTVQNIYLPPLPGLQIFIFLFELVLAAYSCYLLPCFDNLKLKFNYYRFSIKAKETGKVTSSLISLIFILVTKALALFLSIYFMIEANSETNEQIDKYEFGRGNQSVINDLKTQTSNGSAAIASLFIQVILLTIDETRKIFNS